MSDQNVLSFKYKSGSPIKEVNLKLNNQEFVCKEFHVSDIGNDWNMLFIALPEELDLDVEKIRKNGYLAEQKTTFDAENGILFLTLEIEENE